jgi:hypothetical protein
MAIIIPLIPLIKSLADGLLSFANLRKVGSEAAREEAEAADKISAAWERLNKPVMERIEKLERRVVELERENRALWDWAKSLERQIHAAGMTPVAPAPIIRRDEHEQKP